MNTMTALDASFLHIEDAVSHMHIGSVLMFEGPAPAHRDVLASIAGKLELVPRYRQRVRTLPLSFGRPSWVDDPHFKLDYHVRRTALPAPGGDQELRNLVGRVMAQKLDRAKPLWEMWVVEGVGEGRWAMISKVHHVMVDGVSATDLMSVLLDADRDASPAEETPWAPAHAPSTAEAMVSAVVAQAVEPLKGLRDLAGTIRDPGALAARAATIASGLRSVAGVLRQADDSTLNGPIGPHRRWAWASGRMADIKAIRDAHGASVNDVVLAVIARGFRDLLISRGESVEGRVVHTLVPVSVRTPGERGAYNNKVSSMFAALPVGVEDPVERVSAVRSQMELLKRSGQAVAGATLTSLSGFAPPMLFALGARAGARATVPDQHHHHERPRAPAPDVFRRAEDAERVPVRPARREGAYRRRDLLLRRQPELRRDRRLRHSARHRDPDQGHRGGDPRAGPTRPVDQATQGRAPPGGREGMTAAPVRHRPRDLERKVALVTGGAHGLGRHTCGALAWAGARVVVVDIDEHGGDAVARAVGGAFVAADLSRSDANHEVVAAAMEQYGRLDLVHLGPSTSADPARYRETMSSMVDRVTYGTQVALPAFEATGDGGAIVAASSEPSRDPTDVASDHALIGLARALGAVLAPRQVRFNAVLPDSRARIAEATPVDDLYDKLVRTVDSADAGDAVVALLAGEVSGECWLVRSSRDDAQRPPSALRA